MFLLYSISVCKSIYTEYIYPHPRAHQLRVVQTLQIVLLLVLADDAAGVVAMPGDAVHVVPPDAIATTPATPHPVARHHRSLPRLLTGWLGVCSCT